MKLISQQAKKIMEACKKRAIDAGLRINGETLEYIITNKEMIELEPKIMVPTIYDYWVDDIEVIRDKWVYDANPHNAYETVINTRPPLSFYNDNNPDWMNAMIFYHVLGHIDFFQNNVYFRNTWNDDFCGEALADKRLINRIREERGAEKRWVDYVIEFARGVDNLVGYYAELEELDSDSRNILGTVPKKIDFYFGEFLRARFDEKFITLKFYYDEIERYANCSKEFGQKHGQKHIADIFFSDAVFKSKFPEFHSVFDKHEKEKHGKVKPKDILQHLMEYSDFVNKDENKWMKDVMGVVRRTSLYFQPQIRDKIANEGWASVWHDRLFMTDDIMRTHEVDFATVNAWVLSDRRVGTNPYIFGKRMYEFIEEMARKGKLSYEYQLLKDIGLRKHFDTKAGDAYAKEMLFAARRNLNDYGLVNFLSDDDFQDFVDRYHLFVAGQRFNEDKFVIETYIKSKNGKDYRIAMNDTLYHPPHVIISAEKAKENELYLDHKFEGRSLITGYIPPVLIGLAYLSQNKIKLETTEFEQEINYGWPATDDEERAYARLRVLYTCEKKKVTREILDREEV